MLYFERVTLRAGGCNARITKRSRQQQVLQFKATYVSLNWVKACGQWIQSEMQQG